MDAKKKKKYQLVQHTITVLVILVALVITVVLFNSTIKEIKKSSDHAKMEILERNFDFIWDYLQTLTNHAEYHVIELADHIENDIKTKFNLTELEKAMNSGNDNDPIMVQFHSMILSHIHDTYFGDIKNNRNHIIVLDNSEKIIEDLFVDVNSRSEDSTDQIFSNIYDYRQTTYNVDLFDSALDKIRTHSDQPIAIEPYNYLSDSEHMMLTEMNFFTLKDIYLHEGLSGLRNYQFLVPAYITESGDVFGNYDHAYGENDENHKIVIIQTFNLYDQLTHIDPDFESNTQYGQSIERHERILSAIYIFGIILAAVFVFIVLYFFTLYNNILDDNES